MAAAPSFVSVNVRLLVDGIQDDIDSASGLRLPGGAAYVPAIHVLLGRGSQKTWMPAFAGMTAYS
jgi:hypothetical protein